MASYIMNRETTVLCMHGGQAQATVPDMRVRVEGHPVVTQSAPFSVSGCPFTTPAGSPLPCVTAQWVTAALRVRASGMPVLLANSGAVCMPNGTGVNIVPSQFRVKGS